MTNRTPQRPMTFPSDPTNGSGPPVGGTGPGRQPPGPGPVPFWFVATAVVLVVATLAIVVLLLGRDDGGVDVRAEDTAPEPSTATLPSTSVSTAAPDGGATTTTGDSTTASSVTSATTAPPSTSGGASSGQPTTSATNTSATNTSATTTAPPTSQATTGTTTPAEPTPAVWPWPSSSLRFADPVEAARSFALDYIGFADPVVGPFLQGDGRSGEVDVRPDDDGPVTTVLVRQVGPDDRWSVIGAVTADIEVDEPGPLDAVGATMVVSGRAVAFEGMVEVEVRIDGSTDPVVDGVVTGGGTGMQGFREQLDLPAVDADAGALVLTIRSPDNGAVEAVAVVRLRFRR